MKPHNLKTATSLCADLAQLKSHQAEFEAIKTDSLPEKQFNAQNDYSQKLIKDIKIMEKQIAEL